MKRPLILISILSVISVLGMAGLWYGSATMQEKKDAEKQLRADLLDEGQKWKKLAVLRRSLILAEGNRRDFEKYFYDSSEESQIAFVSKIEQLGTSTTGAIVETRSLDLVQKPLSFRGVFTITGSWHQLYHVLRLVEEYPGRIIIDRFNVKEGTPDKDHKEPLWIGTLQVELISIKAAS